MVALPVETPRTTPLESTVATDGVSLRQSATEATEPSECVAVPVNVYDSLNFSMSTGAVIVTEETTTAGFDGVVGIGVPLLLLPQAMNDMRHTSAMAVAISLFMVEVCPRELVDLT